MLTQYEAEKMNREVHRELNPISPTTLKVILLLLIPVIVAALQNGTDEVGYASTAVPSVDASEQGPQSVRAPIVEL